MAQGIEGHTEIFRMSNEDNNGKPVGPQLEIDYCKGSNCVVFRCKSWLHIDSESVRHVIKVLEHVQLHHVKQSEDAPQNARDSIGVDNKPPDNVA